MNDSNSKSNETRERGPVGRAIEDLLIGTVESIARAGAKALESLTTDASKAVSIQKKKIDVVAKAVKTWREINVGEIDGDVPAELREEGRQVKEHA